MLSLGRFSLAAGSLFLISCDAPQAPQELAVPTAPVVPVIVQDVPLYAEAVGETAGSLDIQVRARIDGVIESLHFQEGRRVRKDQLLYKIDPAPFRAKVRDAEGQLAQAKADFVRADSNLKRVRPLVAIDALSQRTLDEAEAQFKAAQGLVESAEAILENAEIELGYAEIRSPIDGLIGASEAYENDYVGRSPNPIVLNTISKLDPIKVRFAISESEYLDLVRRGIAKKEDTDPNQPPEERPQNIELYLADGSQHPHLGRFTFAGREIDTATGTLQVEAVFPNPEESLRPGQFARIRSALEVQEDALLVPQRAVVELQGTYQVFVVNENSEVEVRRVRTGERVGELWVILEGISAGEQVVAAGLHRLRPGMKVVTTPYEPEATAGSGS